MGIWDVENGDDPDKTGKGQDLKVEVGRGSWLEPLFVWAVSNMSCEMICRGGAVETEMEDRGALSRGNGEELRLPVYIGEAMTVDLLGVPPSEALQDIVIETQ